MSKEDYAEVQNEYESDLSYLLFAIDDSEMERFRLIMAKHMNGTCCASERLKNLSKRRRCERRRRAQESILSEIQAYLDFALKWPLKVHKKFYK